jgi:hypothetical protein
MIIFPGSCSTTVSNKPLAAGRLLEKHAPDGQHTIVLGDFDETPDAASMRFWRGRQSLDGFSISSKRNNGSRSA